MIRLYTATLLALLFVPVAANADTLREIYELALENDAQLKSAEATYLSGLEDRNLGMAGLLPQISASYEYTNSDTDVDSPNIDTDNSGGFTVINTSTNIDTDTTGYNLSLRQPLFDMAAWFQFKTGSMSSRAAEATFAADQQNLIVRVAEAYFTVLGAQDDLSSAEAQETAFQRQLEQTQQRFEVGLIAITDVHEARAGFDLAVVTRLTAENILGVAMEDLEVLTGQGHSDLFRLKEDYPIASPAPTDRSAWVDFALANNYSLEAARRNAESARLNAKSAKAGHYPTISAVVNVSDMETDGDRTQNPPAIFNVPPDQNTENTTIQFRLDMPLYSGGAVSAQRRQAYQSYNAVRENFVSLQRNTVRNTRSLHLTINTDVARVAARRQGITSSQSALDATQAGYEVGTRNIVDVLNAQNQLFTSQRDYANSRYDYVVNMLRLKQQAGQLSPGDINDINTWLEAAATR
ncbi:MAG: outer membrane protein [Halieaceae bacterium]|jgi:outer membrane protein